MAFWLRNLTLLTALRNVANSHVFHSLRKFAYSVSVCQVGVMDNAERPKLFSSATTTALFLSLTGWAVCLSRHDFKCLVRIERLEGTGVRPSPARGGLPSGRVYELRSALTMSRTASSTRSTLSRTRTGRWPSSGAGSRIGPGRGVNQKSGEPWPCWPMAWSRKTRFPTRKSIGRSARMRKFASAPKRHTSWRNDDGWQEGTRDERRG